MAIQLHAKTEEAGKMKEEMTDRIIQLECDQKVNVCCNANTDNKWYILYVNCV